MITRSEVVWVNIGTALASLNAPVHSVIANSKRRSVQARLTSSQAEMRHTLAWFGAVMPLCIGLRKSVSL